MGWIEDGFDIQDKERVLNTIADYETIKEHIIKIAERVATYNDYGNWDIDEDEFEFGPDRVSFTVSKWRCGDEDHEYLEFPLSYLWDDEWEAKEEEAMKAREEAKRKQAAEAMERRIAEQVAREKAQLERLKEKYEGKDG